MRPLASLLRRVVVGCAGRWTLTLGADDVRAPEAPGG